MQISSRAAALAIKTDDAYMASLYRVPRWQSAIQELINAGWSDEQIEFWMRSKAARWASDNNETPMAYFAAVGQHKSWAKAFADNGVKLPPPPAGR